MRLTRALATWLAVATLMSACVGDDDGDDRALGRQHDSRMPSPALAESNTGHFASRTVGAGGVLHSTLEGDYRLTPPAARATVTRYRDDEVVRATEVLAIGRDAWSQQTQPLGAAPCWVHYDVTELFANGLLVRNGDTYFPAPVAVVGLGRGVYSTAPSRSPAPPS